MAGDLWMWVRRSGYRRPRCKHVNRKHEQEENLNKIPKTNQQVYRSNHGSGQERFNVRFYIFFLIIKNTLDLLFMSS